MAIAFDASAITSTDNSGVYSWNHVTGSGANRILIVGITLARYYAVAACTGVTYDGSAMTKARSDATNNGNFYVETSVWILHNPASGTKEIVATADGDIFGISCTYTGAQQSSTADAVGGTTGTSAGDKSASITTVADNSWIFAAGSTYGQSAALSALQTERRKGASMHVGIGEDTNAAQTPAGAKTIGFTVGNCTGVCYAISAASFAPIAEATISRPAQVIII